MAKRPCPFCGYVEVKVSTRDQYTLTQCTSCSSILEKKPTSQESTLREENNASRK